MKRSCNPRKFQEPRNPHSTFEISISIQPAGLSRRIRRRIMNQRPLLKSILKLFAVCIMFGGLVVLSSTEKVNADGCDTAFGECVYDRCQTLSGSQFDGCVNQCNLEYEICRLGAPSTSPSGSDPLPQPWPVFNRFRSICLSGCQQGCSSFADPVERLECYMPCWEYCNETYPKY